MMVTERSLSGRSGRALPVRDRRRGDRIDTDFAALRSVANGTKRTHRDSPLFVRFRGRSGHQPAIAYGHATTLSLDQLLPETDKMKWSDDVVSAERCHTVEFFGAPW